MRRIQLLLVALIATSPLALSGQATADRSSPPRASSAAQEQAQVFVNALQAISQLHQNAYSDSTLWAKALDGLLSSIDDPYAAVFTPTEAADFEEENTGNYTGIGIQITQLNNVVTVTGVFRGTPANDVGMQVGDIIVSVDDEDTSEWTTEEVSNVVRGQVGTQVQVSVVRPGYDNPIEFPITRAEVHVPAVEADRIEGDIVYVVMDRVARNAAQELDQVLQDNRDAAGFVIDLRQNPGGYLDESLMLADLFLQPGQRLASTQSRAPGSPTGVEEDSWEAQVPARVPDIPIVVLVDPFTASAAEILAGALQDYDRALVIGQRTFGKGVVQTVLELPYGRQLRLTTGSWYTPLGRSLHRRRDAQGRPYPEQIDTLPTIFTDGGRELIASGGIFPDLEVANDTLVRSERDLLVFTAEQGVPLPLRLAEFAFGQAVELEESGQGPQLRPEAFDDFVSKLRTDGVPEEFLSDEEVLGYLAWRAEIEIATRMDRLGASIQVRMQRDPVLEQAVSLLRGSATQQELFSAAGAERGRVPLDRVGSDEAGEGDDGEG